MNKKDENGFGAVEIIMAVVIVVLFATLIYFFVQANQKNSQNNSSATPSVSPQTKKSSSSSPSAEAGSPLTNDSVKSTVDSFYRDYYKNMRADAKTMEAAVSQYGTQNFISTYMNIMHGNQAMAGDPVMCINGGVNSYPTATDIKITSDKATAIVKVTESIMPSVTVVDDKGLKIDSVSCAS